VVYDSIAMSRYQATARTGVGAIINRPFDY